MCGNDLQTLLDFCGSPQNDAVERAYLNELAPVGTRAVLPGFVYQLGNLIASVNAPLQAEIAKSYSYGTAMAIVAGTVAILICVLISTGRDTRGVALDRAEGQAHRAVPSRS